MTDLSGFNNVITVASITVTFYAFYANLLYKREDEFSKVLFIVLIVNILFIAFVVYTVLSNSLNNPNPDLTYVIYDMSVSWYISVLIVLFSYLNFFILDLKKIHDQNPDIKYYLYTILNYGLIFIIFILAFQLIITKNEGYSLFITIIFFVYLIISYYVNESKTNEKAKKIEEKINITQVSPTDEIKKAKGLLDNGIINDEEFARIKEKYL